VATPEEKLIKDSLSAILLGYSVTLFKGQQVFIKHFGYCDSIETDYQYKIAYDECIKKKIYTEEQKLALAAKQNLWSVEDDKQITILQNTVDSLSSSRDKTPLPSQKAQIVKQLEEKKTELYNLKFKRFSLLGTTAESIATQRSEDFYIFKSFYKDRDCKTQLFSDEEFNNIEDDEMEELKILYFNTLQYILNNNIRKISLSSAFMSLMYLTENSYEILGKPLSQYTFYQMDLITYGKMYKHILSSDPRPPDNIRNNPDELDRWMNKVSATRQIDGKQLIDAENTGKMVMGATVDDVKEIFGDANVINVGSEIKKKGRMSKEEIMKLHGL
jgi:hypothetical protein